ncbi:hypothetical protein COB52_00565 [Candidatus Kaiserbacteria bacterium]|nr:MAG: hypothetical protein COB52_00565 [Candidatus Kaiserbacteria bacterium]
MDRVPELSSYSPSEHRKISEDLFSVKRYQHLIKSAAQGKTSDLDQQIRRQRHEAWLRTTYSIFFDKCKASESCAFWSRQAENLIEIAWRESGLDDQPLAIFALGKLGAGELNLSSDVDLMILSEDGMYDKQPVQVFQKLLHRPSEFGFALRLDFDLRAGGRLGPFISSQEQFEDYYGNYSETWERMAFVRLKPLFGQKNLLQWVAEFARKFSYKRFIDYTLFEDFKLLRPEIHASFQNDENNFNLKLHPGGIRDIELFTHAMQVIHGGKIPELQISKTEDALKTLARLRLLPQKDSSFLIESYWRLRDLENRIQAINDQQTHTVAFDADPWVFKNTSVDQLQHLTTKVDTFVSALLGSSKDEKFSFPIDKEKQSCWLREKDFSEQSIETVWPKLIETKARSRSFLRDEKARLSFLSQFLDELSKLSLDKDLALHLLTDFMTATRAKASFYTLFNREPALIRDLAFLLSASPYLGGILSSRPELMDAFFLRRSDPTPEEFDEALEFLTDKRLITELISANDFLPQRNISMLLASLSQNADEICCELLNLVKKQLDLKEQSIKILSMGKWAGHELGFQSDLDFVLVTESEVDQNTHKLARRFLSTLSTRTRGGSIYSTDLRLRPSGKSGPIIVSEAALLRYLRFDAQPWERQAYLKSRFLQKSKTEPGIEVIQRGFSSEDLLVLRKIRTQLKNENQCRNPNDINLKYHPGGLVDIEFSVQIACICQEVMPEDASTLGGIEALAGQNPDWRIQSHRLSEHYLFLRTMEQLNQLCTRQPGSVLSFEQGRFDRVARLLAEDPAQLEQSLRDQMKEVFSVLEVLDPSMAKRTIC